MNWGLPRVNIIEAWAGLGIIFVVTMLPASMVQAQMSDDERAYVEANLIGIFYHELGHAVIDLNEVPIFAQEEDAADVFSVLLIDMLNDEETAQLIAYDAAFGYIEYPDGEADIPYWDVHGPDEQRFYNHVCLFFGAAPEQRADLAKDLELPKERLETCAEEFDQAIESWNPVFDELTNSAAGKSIKFVSDAATQQEQELFAISVIENEIQALNTDFALPETLSVRVETCGEANAFYDPEDISITMCIEFVDYLIKRMPGS